VIAVPPSYCSGCYGGYSGYGAYAAAPVNGGAIPVAPVGTPKVTMPPADPTVAPQTDAEREAVRNLLEKLRKAKKPGESGIPGNPSSANTAHLTVNLPADAHLWVDEVECPLTSSVRSFNTPPLQPGQTYYYTLKVQVDGKTGPVTENQRVLVTAGQEVTVNFNNYGALATAQR
jgi:uncharacterized protein (TIGR03000 family)